jgi:hypothetical protein
MSRRFAPLIVLAITAISVPSSAARASTFLSVSGPILGSIGLGGEGSPGDEQVGAVEFTTNGLSDATISVTLTALLGSQTIDAWVTNKIGPGTTAANVVAATTFAGPAYQTAVESPFSSLTLASGTYYLVLSALDAPNLTGWDDTKSSAEAISSTVGNSYAASFGNSDVYGSFAPAGVISDITSAPNDDDLLFSVTMSATPLPSTWIVMLAGLIALGGFVWKRRTPLTIAG